MKEGSPKIKSLPCFSGILYRLDVIFFFIYTYIKYHKDFIMSCSIVWFIQIMETWNQPVDSSVYTMSDLKQLILFLVQCCDSDLPFGRKSSELGLSGAFLLEEVCSLWGGRPRNFPSLSSRALAIDYKQNNTVHHSTVCMPVQYKCRYLPRFPDLSVGWLMERSGHCTVSGPSGDGVSGAPSGLDDSATCCSSVRGCSSIQLANTSMVWESRSPATSGRDHREVELSEFKKKRRIMECCIAKSCRTPAPDDHASVHCLRSGWHMWECVRRVNVGTVWNRKWGKDYISKNVRCLCDQKRSC